MKVAITGASDKTGTTLVDKAPKRRHQVVAVSRIINEIKGVNRVSYDITSNPPGTIERA
ncbi:MAG TPA: hypothetical protein VIN96_13575 [Magnetovibrio sp.]